MCRDARSVHLGCTCMWGARSVSWLGLQVIPNPRACRGRKGPSKGPRVTPAARRRLASTAAGGNCSQPAWGGGGRGLAMERTCTDRHMRTGKPHTQRERERERETSKPMPVVHGKQGRATPPRSWDQGNQGEEEIFRYAGTGERSPTPDPNPSLGDNGRSLRAVLEGKSNRERAPKDRPGWD